MKKKTKKIIFIAFIVVGTIIVNYLMIKSYLNFCNETDWKKIIKIEKNDDNEYKSIEKVDDLYYLFSNDKLSIYFDDGEKNITINNFTNSGVIKNEKGKIIGFKFCKSKHTQNNCGFLKTGSVLNNTIEKIVIRNINNISYINNNYLLISKFVDGVEKFGVININGKIIIDPVYDEITSIYKTDFIIANNNGKSIIINLDNLQNKIIFDNPIIKCNDGESLCYSFIQNYKFNNKIYFIIKNLNNKYGVIDQNNNLIIDYKYDNLSYNETRKILFNYEINDQNKKMNIINLDGSLVKEIELPKDIDISNNINNLKYTNLGTSNLANFLFISKNKNTFYFINMQNNLLTINNLSLVTSDNDEVYFPNYLINDKYYVTNNNGNYMIYDINGKPLINYNLKSINMISNSFIEICKDENNCGAFNIDNGNFVEPNNKPILLQTNLGKTYLSSDGYFSIYDDKISPKLKCSNINFKDVIINKKTAFIINNNNKYLLFDLNCNKLTNRLYMNMQIKNNYIYAILNNNISGIENTYTDIYTQDGKLILNKNQHILKNSNDLLFYYDATGIYEYK
jgi:hypothetical protein